MLNLKNEQELKIKELDQKHEIEIKNLENQNNQNNINLLIKKIGTLDADGAVKLLNFGNIIQNQNNQYLQPMYPQQINMSYQPNYPMYPPPYYNQPIYNGNPQFITPNGPNMNINSQPPMNYQYNQMNNYQQTPFPWNPNNQGGIYNSGFQPPMNNNFPGGPPPMQNSQIYNNSYGGQPLPQSQPIYNNNYGSQPFPQNQLIYNNVNNCDENHSTMKGQQTDINQNQIEQSQKNN